MPLVRFEVRNEYGLGDPELYRAEAKKEDPRAVLDGVAVAGLVGILRQLGDLAEFAADIFNDLQEQVITTASRGRKILNRIQRIESALPLIEKAVQGQRSYIHFAYIAGSDWHAKVRIGQSQLLSSDLPQFMIDSYEECHDPPRLYLLDKFDSFGAGACLKRYSDPSYFKRALASSEPVKAEKVQRKKKKRGSRLRNEGIPNAVFTSRDISSKQFASPSTDQLSFSGENASFFDTRSKSELARESMHFDSETRSNCVDQVSDMPSMVPCEPEYSGFSAPTSKSSNSNASASVQNEPKQDMADENSQPESLHQQSAPSTSSVMWDEKTEIVKSAGANLYEAEFVDRVQDLDSQSQIFETSNLDSETTKVGTFNQEDIVFELAEAPVSYPCGNLFDEVPTETGNFAPAPYPGGNLFDEVLTETGTAPVPYPDGNMSGEALIETDNFKDATTALEPELGSDSECRTKLELGSFNFNYGVLESRSCKLNETSVTDSDCFDAQVPIAPCSSLTNSVLSDGFDHVQSTDTDRHSPKSDFSVGNGYSKGHIPCMPGTSVSRLLDDELSPNPSIPNEQDVLVSNGTTDESSKTQDCPVNNSKLPSVSFWTNGGILGLEPSKPPDFSINANSEAVAMSNVRKSRNVCSSGEERDKSDGDLPVRKISQDCLQGPSLTDLGKNEEAPLGGTYAYTNGPDHREINVYSPVSDLTAVGNTVSHSSGSDKNLTGISNSFSGLANKFLSNSLQRRILVAHTGLSTPSQLVNADFRKLQEILLQNDHKEPKRVVPNALREPETEENIEVGSSGKPVPFSSPYLGSYSPPLELMKISFHPMNSLDTSKLKLEFSSGNLHEGTGDLVFPSFQLIPGPSTTVQVCSSDSDDDTFCRSSVYSSDDLLSLYPESNSEFWGEDERSDSQKHSVSDDSCRNSSSATSVCNTMKFEQMDRCSLASELEHLEVENGRISDSMKDLTSANSIVDDKCQQHETCESLPFNSISSTAHSPNELPLPLPLPPLQWRVVKESNKNHSAEDNNSNCMRVIEHLDAEAQSYATHKQQEQDAPRSSCNAESVPDPSKEMDQLILTGTGEPNCNYNFKEQNRREDLLDQIRSKSFNLRRTTTAKLNHDSGPVADAAVAVMGKEHVIQQAFSFSHMRREDNWSEG